MRTGRSCVGGTRAAAFKLTHENDFLAAMPGPENKENQQPAACLQAPSVKPEIQAFLAAERRMASLISAMERSIAASSRSSTSGVEHARLNGGGKHAVHDAVGRHAAGWTQTRPGFPTPSPARSRCRCARPPLRKRIFDQIGHRLGHSACWPVGTRFRHRSGCPTGHPSTASACRPAAAATGPVMSNTGLVGEPRQVNRMLRLMRSRLDRRRCALLLQDRSGPACASATRHRAPDTAASRRNAPRSHRRPAHGRHQRGARRVEHAFFGGIANDLVVRGHQRD